MRYYLQKGLFVVVWVPFPPGVPVLGGIILFQSPCPSHAPSFTALPVRAKIRLASQIGGETLKDFSDFLKEYSENQEFKDRMADAAAGNLSVEQFSAVSKMLLILLRKYHEWSQT